MDNREKAKQLLCDLGEVEEKYIDEADTQIAQHEGGKKKISWSYIGIAAAAACIAVMVGLNLPERNTGNQTVPGMEGQTPLLTDMQENDFGSETEEIITDAEDYTKEAEVSETDIPSETEAVTEEEETYIVEEYFYYDDIKCDSAKAYVMSDGSICLNFEYGKFTLTLPGEWTNHFILDGNILKSKIASENTDGKLVSFGFTEGKPESSTANLLGRCQDEFWSFHYASDVTIDMENEAESEEYNMLLKDLDRVLATAASEVTGTGEYRKTGDISDMPGYSGEIKTTDGHSVAGQSDSYVLYGVPGGTWEVEEGWHVTAESFKFTESGLMYDCYDTDDGDHYGWILANEIEFYN